MCQTNKSKFDLVESNAIHYADMNYRINGHLTLSENYLDEMVDNGQHQNITRS